MLKKNLILSFLLISSFLFLNAQDWETDLEKTKEIAKEKDRNIVLVFSGSDWCAPCIKLESEIWSTEEFKNYANDNFVLLKADFPRKKKNKLSEKQQEKNNQLAEKYNTQGYFPLVVVMDKNGKVLGTTGYEKMEPAEYIKLLASFK